jgi:triacylglycerol lipase
MDIKYIILIIVLTVIVVAIGLVFLITYLINQNFLKSCKKNSTISWGKEKLTLETSNTTISNAKFLLKQCSNSMILFCLKDKFKPPSTFTLYNELHYDNEVAGFTIKNDKTAIICWRGTQSLNDIYTDLEYSTEKPFFSSGEGVLIHSGFNNAFKSALDEVKSFISSLGTQTTLYITGHSLGGALATLNLYWLMNNNFPKSISKVSCYSFASPKIGNKKFKDDFESKLKPLNFSNYRFQNLSDVIPLTPPSGEYLHVNTPIYINYDSGTLVDNHFITSYKIALYKCPLPLSPSLCKPSPMSSITSEISSTYDKVKVSPKKIKKILNAQY